MRTTNITTSHRYVGSDCTGPYDITIRKQMTVGEFIDEWTTECKGEWGYFGIDDGFSTFGDPKCEYRYGEIITAPLPDNILKSHIEHVSGSGGWTRSDFKFVI